MNVGTGEVARLRDTPDDRPLDLPGDGIRVPEIVLRRILEEGIHVAEGGEADAEHVRILDSVDDLVQQRWIEPVLQANVDWQAAWKMGGVEILWCPRKRVSRVAMSEGPVRARYHRADGNDAVDGFVRMGDERRFRRIQRRRQGRDRLSHDVQ